MKWSALFFLNSVLLGVGLAMDAFSVSMVNGLNEPKMSRRKGAAVAGTFGFFQALMPMTGWLCVRTMLHYFEAFQKCVPWIALGLLLYVGGSMLLEGLRGGGGENSGAAVTPWGLFVQGVATSIDALSVGFTIADYDLTRALAASLIIAAVTYGISSAGLLIGRTMGVRLHLANRAAILGGVILIGVGLEIFIAGVM